MALALARDPTAYSRSTGAVSRLTPSVSTPTLPRSLLTPRPIEIASSEMGIEDTWARRPSLAAAEGTNKGGFSDAFPDSEDTN